MPGISVLHLCVFTLDVTSRTMLGNELVQYSDSFTFIFHAIL